MSNCSWYVLSSPHHPLLHGDETVIDFYCRGPDTTIVFAGRVDRFYLNDEILIFFGIDERSWEVRGKIFIVAMGKEQTEIRLSCPKSEDVLQRGNPFT